LKASQEPTNEEVAEMVNMVDSNDLYKRRIRTREDMEKLGATDNSFLSGVIHGIEVKLEVSRKSAIWEAVSEQATKRIRVELPILFSKTGSLEATIGRRVKNEMPDVEAPTIWSSIASLATMIHETQSRVQDTVTMSAVMSNDIEEEVGKYIEQKLQATGVPNNLKLELTTELSQYVENRLSAEMLHVNHKMKKMHGDLCSTVEKISSRFQSEALQVNNMRARLEYVELNLGTISNHPSSSLNAADVRQYVKLRWILFTKKYVMWARK
jgi:hypothetical protein